jgi:hypothetical protein
MDFGDNDCTHEAEARARGLFSCEFGHCLMNIDSYGLFCGVMVPLFYMVQGAFP